MYDTAGRVWKTIAVDENNDEQVTTYEYDKSGRQTATADANDYNLNKATDYTEDAETGFYEISETKLAEILADGFIDTLDNVSTTIYEGTRRKSATDDRGNTTEFRYDCLSRVIKTIYPATAQNPATYTHTGYDSFGRKVWQSNQVTQAEAEDVPDSEIKDFEYDSSSRLTAAVLPQVADPENSNTNTYPRYEYKYNKYGNLTAIWDKIKQYESSTDYTHKRETTFTYDHLSNQTSRKLPNNSIEYKWYDEFGRIEKAKDFKGQVIGYFYNNRGLPEYQKYYDSEADYPDEPNSVVRYTYDNLGRKEQIIEGRGTTTYHYDTEGNVTQIDSPEGVIHYDYSNITGRKDRTWTADSPADTFADAVTVTEYSYDQLGRLEIATCIKRNGSTLTTPEVTTYNYDAAGNRNSTVLANNVTADYTYDNCNRLTNLTNTHNVNGILSSFVYGLHPDGMRNTLTETLKYAGGATETHNITYTYDDLNRLTQESADTVPTGSGYTADYTYDLVGNRLEREILANGQTLTTEYQYYADGSDRLYREIHTGPVAAVPIGDERYYAYAGPGGNSIFYKSTNGKPISAIKAFMLGLPNEWARYVLTMILVCVPLSFFVPFVICYVRRLMNPLWKKQGYQLSLWQRCLCVLLAYTMLITPCGLESIAYAASQYSQIATTNWSSGNRTIEYAYDDNGSVTQKLTKETSTSTTLEKIEYEYNLQNRLSKQTTKDGSDAVISWTKFTYNDDGIRVKKEHFDSVDTTVTTYLIDSYNHTGYAQILEETADDSSTVTVKTYTIGEDIITQSAYDGSTTTTNHLLYDGQDSTRQTTNNTGAVTDCFSYDGYGVTLGNPSTTSTNLLYAGQMYDSHLDSYYLRARYYSPRTGTFNRIDPYAGNNQDPQSLHKYFYCHANPVNNTDPSGNMEFSLTEMLTVATIVGTVNAAVAGAVTAVKGGTVRQVLEAQAKWFWISFGLSATIYGTAWFSYSLLVALFGAGAGLGNLQYAKEYGIQRFNDLREVVRGTELVRHHIIEQRFAERLGLNRGDMLSIIVDKPEHQVFTNAWRNAIAYGTNYSKVTTQELWLHAQEVYRDYPALLEAAKIQLFGGNK